MQSLNSSPSCPGDSQTTDSGWSSRFAFMMASIGFAVGLGNIWRFPYVTGENGGGAFVLLYLLCVFAIGAPILIAELLIGRQGKMSPPNALQKIAQQQNRSPRWRLVGHMNLLAAFIIMLVYSVIAGWVLHYLFKSVATGFVGTNGAMAAQTYNSMLSDPSAMLLWTLTGLGITGSIIYAGVQNGIEKAVTVLMPTLFVLMVVLVGYNIIVGGFGETLRYLFTVDFGKINSSTVLAAVGQAFFSIGVAMAGMMTYGAYLPAQVSIPRSTVLIVCADTLVALIAGLVIFPAVFNNGLDPASGPGLIFQTLPVAFSNMPGGHVVSVLFFLLLSVAAITSMVGLIEPLTKWLEEQRQLSRHKSALYILSAIGTLSLFSIFGYSALSEFSIGGKDINGILDYLSNQILLPAGGLLIALFAGWFINRRVLVHELGLGDGSMFKLWYFLIRYISPIAVALIFVLGVSE